MDDRIPFNTDNAPAAVGPYSQAIRSGGLLFISGQLPIDMLAGGFPATIGEQAECCLRNLDAIAREAGSTLQNAVKATIFLTDMNDFAEVNAVYEKFFPGIPPARSCIAVLGLPKNARIEIEAICAYPAAHTTNR